jgi:hypothetical protein
MRSRVFYTAYLLIASPGAECLPLHVLLVACYQDGPELDVLQLLQVRMATNADNLPVEVSVFGAVDTVLIIQLSDSSTIGRPATSCRCCAAVGVPVLVCMSVTLCRARVSRRPRKLKERTNPQGGPGFAHQRAAPSMANPVRVKTVRLGRTRNTEGSAPQRHPADLPRLL